MISGSCIQPILMGEVFSKFQSASFWLNVLDAKQRKTMNRDTNKFKIKNYRNESAHQFIREMSSRTILKGDLTPLLMSLGFQRIPWGIQWYKEWLLIIIRTLKSRCKVLEANVKSKCASFAVTILIPNARWENTRFQFTQSSDFLII